MTPQAFEAKWIASEEKLARWLARGGRSTLLGASFLIGIYTFLAWAIKAPQDFPEWTRLNVHLPRLPINSALICLSFLALHFRQSWFFGLALTLAWLAFAWHLDAYTFWICVYPLYFMMAYFGLRLALTQPTGRKRWTAALGLTLGFFVCMYAAGRSVGAGYASYMSAFWMVHPEYAWITLIYIALYFPGREKASWDLALTPALVALPLPLPLQTRIERASPETVRALWWHGFLNLAQSAVYLGLAIGIFLFPLSEIRILQSAQKYLYFILFTSSGMNFATGVFRIYGLHVPEASRFLFFADAPLEVWRRASTYAYQMILNLLFIPLMRLTRSATVTATLVSIFVVAQMFWIHEIALKAFYIYLFPQFGMTFAGTARVFEASLRFAAGWVILVFAFHWLRKILPWNFTTPGRSWLMIAINHLAVISLLIFLME